MESTVTVVWLVSLVALKGTFLEVFVVSFFCKLGCFDGDA